MYLTSGHVSIDDNVSIALQEPWLMSGSVRENILFMSDFEPEWYNRVVRACCLRPDFEQFDQGDETLVGQEGIALSGRDRHNIWKIFLTFKSFKFLLKVYENSTKT